MSVSRLAGAAMNNLKLSNDVQRAACGSGMSIIMRLTSWV